MTQDQKSFNDAMQEWRAQQSLTVRLFHGYFHLPREYGVLGMILGLLWRLLLPAAIAWVVYCIMVSSHLGSVEFRTSFAGKLEAYFRAEEDSASIEALKWEDGALKMKGIEMTGAPGSFFRELKARNVSLRKNYSFFWPFSVVGDSPWEFGEIRATQLILDFKSGYEGSSGATTGAGSGSGELMRAGMGVDPDLSQATFKKISATSTTLRWGHSKTTRGEIEGTDFEAERTSEGAWKFRLAGGTLSQSWIRKAGLVSLEATLDGDTITFENGVLRIGEDEVEMGGTIVLGVLPALDITLNFKQTDPKSLLLEAISEDSKKAEETETEPILSEAYANAFVGELTGELKVGGSINSRDGVTTQAEFVIAEDSSVKTPAAFKDFATAFQQPGLQQIYLKEGRLSFKTERGALFIENLQLLSRGGAVKVTGEFEIDEGNFYGELALGLESSVLAENPVIAEKHFEDEEDGFRWKRGIELRGVYGELTRELSNTLAEEIREAGRR